MARVELTLSLDAMISLEQKRDINVPPYPRFASNLGSICKEFSGTVVRWATGRIQMFDRRSRALVRVKQSDDLSPIRRLYSAVTYGSSVRTWCKSMR